MAVDCILARPGSPLPELLIREIVGALPIAMLGLIRILWPSANQISSRSSSSNKGSRRFAGWRRLR